jgi:hypothetical protein
MIIIDISLTNRIIRMTFNKRKIERVSLVEWFRWMTLHHHVSDSNPEWWYFNQKWLKVCFIISFIKWKSFLMLNSLIIIALHCMYFILVRLLSFLFFSVLVLPCLVLSCRVVSYRVCSVVLCSLQFISFHLIFISFYFIIHHNM